MALNPETTSTLSTHLLSYLEKRFLDRLLVKFHFDKFGMKQKLKKGSGKTVKWHRWANVADSVTPLTEATTPSGIDLSSTTVDATVAQYGQFATTSDFLILTAINDMLKDMIDLLGYAAGKSLDAIIRNEVDVNGTQQFANGLANVAAVQADTTAVLDAGEIRTAVKALRSLDVDEWPDGMFRAIIDPVGEYDLLSETAAGSAIQTVQHTDFSPIEKGMIGSLYGVKFFRSSHIRTNDAPNTNVYKHCLFGMNAYGTVDLEGGNTEIITKGLGSAGSEDPLNQRATVGYKFHYTAKVLDANRIRVINAYGS